MSSIIVLDSSDEDEAPKNKPPQILPTLGTTITITKKPKTAISTSLLSTSHISNHSKNNIINSKKTVISSTLLSSTQTTIAKPKVSTLPKINAAFSINSIERHIDTPTPPKMTTLPKAGTLATGNVQRKRVITTPAAPPKMFFHGNPMFSVMNGAGMRSTIQSVHSMAPSAKPPIQPFTAPPDRPSATPTHFHGPMAIDPLMMHSFSSTNNIGPHNDNFKIHLPLKRPNTVANSSNVCISPTTASTLRSIKRIKPTTLLKNNEDAWLNRQKKTLTSSTSSSLPLHNEKVVGEVFSASPGSSAALSSSSPASHPNNSANQKRGPLTRPPMQQSLSSRRAPPDKLASSIPRIQIPLHSKYQNTSSVKSSQPEVLDLTSSPEKAKIVYNRPPYSLTPSSSSASSVSLPRQSTPNSTVNSFGFNIIPLNTETCKQKDQPKELHKEKGTKEGPTGPTKCEPLIPDYEELLRVCRLADSSADMEELINLKLIKYYYSVHPDFVRSQGFRKQLQVTIERITACPELVYYHLKTIVDELKVRRKGEPATEAHINKMDDGNSLDTTTVSTGNKKIDEQIKKFNKALYIVKKRIEQLEESEVDWDDDDSSYLQVERYKKRACQIFEKICDLTGENKNVLRSVRRPIQFNGTSFPHFNRTLQAYVNKTKEFPDYYDVKRILEHCNTTYSLGLSQFEIMRIAQDAFIKVGKLLQKRRKTDLYETVAHYTADSKDPAVTDPTLLAKLSENQKHKKKISDVIEKYAREQDITAEEARLKRAATLKGENGKPNDTNKKTNRVRFEVFSDDIEDEEFEEDVDEEYNDEEETADVDDDIDTLANENISDLDSDFENDDNKLEEATKTDPLSITTVNNRINSPKNTQTKQTIVSMVSNGHRINNCDSSVKGSANAFSKQSSNIQEDKCLNMSVPSKNVKLKSTEPIAVNNSNSVTTVKFTVAPTIHTQQQRQQHIVTNGRIILTSKTNPNVQRSSSSTMTPMAKPAITYWPTPKTQSTLKIFSVSSLNASIGKTKNGNNSVAIPICKATATKPLTVTLQPKQSQFAEIIISDEES